MAWQDIPVPSRLRGLPRDERGYIIPWFVHIDEHGKHDFRIIGRGKVAEAVNKRKCWLCGQPMGRMLVFCIGPMCAVNRVTSEPPSHFDCAEYAVQVCPFLTRPKMHYQTAVPKPAETVEPAGFMLEHNPGVVCMWITRSYKPFRAGRGNGNTEGVLFELGEPVGTHWYAEGRKATREEIAAALRKGFPLLVKSAKDEGNGAVEALEKFVDRALPAIPGGFPDDLRAMLHG